MNKKKVWNDFEEIQIVIAKKKKIVKFGLCFFFGSWHINFCMVFDANTILLEKQ